MTPDSTDVSHHAGEAATRQIEGKHAILALLLLGLIAAIGSWWYHAQLQRRAIAFWGRDAAILIQYAPHVTLLELEPAAGKASGHARKLLIVGDRPLGIVRRLEADRIAGLVHLRHSLLQDQSFDWAAPPADSPPDWQYAVQFAFDDGRSATVLLDFSGARLMSLDEEKRLSMRPMADGLETFLAAQFGESDGDTNPKREREH